MKPTTAILIALASGLTGSIIGGIINLIIAKSNHKHDVRQKEKENKRNDNILIASILAEIKITLSKIEVNSFQYVHDKINYWRWHHANHVYRDEQAKDSLTLAGLQANDPQRIILQFQIEQRAIALIEGPKETKALQANANNRTQLLNEAISNVVLLITKLSLITGIDLSDMEKTITKYQSLNFSFIPFKEIHTRIKAMQTPDQLNEVDTIMSEADEVLAGILKQYIKKVQKIMAEKKFIYHD